MVISTTRTVIVATLLSAAAPLTAQAAGPQLGVSAEIRLSPKAAAKLASLKEKIMVTAEWYGEPTKATEKKAEENGQILLGSDNLTLPGSGGKAEFKAAKVKAERIGWLKDKQVLVSLSVYSARLSGPDNILDCTPTDDALDVLRAKPPIVTCKLIEGDD